ncbi:palmitoyltransferase for Vac8p [Mortierella alpina]|nr:palmitoyltransferase for Vac8p [Mortierella alpina]
MTSLQQDRQLTTTGIATTTTTTTTTAPAVVMASGTAGGAQAAAHPTYSTAPTEAPMTIDGYRIHSSALATPLSASQNLTAMTAAQHAAALAAHDHAGSDGAASRSAGSGGLPDSVSRLLPVALTALIVYIYNVYTFRVCIDYILHELHRPTQAYIYMGVFNVLTLLFFVSYARTIFRKPGSPLKPPQRNPPPPIPPTTTPYRPERVPKSFSSQGGRGRINEHPVGSAATDSTPLLRSTQHSGVVQTSSTQLYQSTSQTDNPIPSSARLEHGQKVAVNMPPARISKPANGIQDGSTNPTVRIEIGQDQSAERQPEATLSISKKDGSARWCDLCKIVKPDRCHHCSECDTCVLRMDHHCPWVNGCIGYGNHKFFYLFILYGSMLAIWGITTMVPLLFTAIQRCDMAGPWISIPDTSQQQPRCVFNVQWVIITIISTVLAFLIVSFTAAHTFYIVKNRTTIESLQDVRNTFIRVDYTTVPASSLALPSYAMSGPRFNVVMLERGLHLWDRGSCMANWKSIMGPSWWLWFLPYDNTPGDGIHEVYNDEIYKKLLASALAQAAELRARYGGGRGSGIRRATGASTHSAAPAVSHPGTLPANREAESSQSTLLSGMADRRSDSRASSDRSTSSKDISRRHDATPSLAVPPSRTRTWTRSRTSEESDSSVSSLGRSLPTPRSSP